MSSPSAADYRRYVNDRFGFGIDVPDSLIAQAPPTDDDGRTFASPDGHIKLLAYGSNNATGDTPTSSEKQAIHLARADGDSITYTSLVGPAYIISGYLKNDDIFYERSVVLTKVKYSLEWTYPRSLKAALDPAVEHSVTTFTPGPDRAD